MSEERPVKQVIIIRKDLKMRRGKEISQGSHSSNYFFTKRLTGKINTVELSDAEVAWVFGFHTKVTCQVNSEAELDELYNKAHAAGLQAHIVTDAGLTEFNGVATKTSLCIRPDYSDKIDPITKHLPLY